MRALIPVILVSLTGLFAFTLTKRSVEPTVNWISFTELDQLIQSPKWKKEKRKVIVDLYTDWCGWCKRMDKDTYAKERIAGYINSNFYAVKFNAEQKAAVSFGGREYAFKVLRQMKDGNGNVVKEQGTHELAIAIGSVNGRIGYPTTVFLDENLGLIQTLPGYLRDDQLYPMLKYYAEDHYKTVPWDQYQRDFNDPTKGGTIGD